MRCKGFLFDLDGTLVDSLPAVERAWSNWARRHGLAPEEVLAFIHGKQAITSLRHFMAGKNQGGNCRRVYVSGANRGHGNRGYYRASGGNRLTQSFE